MWKNNSKIDSSMPDINIPMIKTPVIYFEEDKLRCKTITFQSST